MKRVALAIVIAFGLSFGAGGAAAFASGAEKGHSHGAKSEASHHHGPPPINWTNAADKEKGIPSSFIFMLINFAMLVGFLVWKGGGALSKYAGKRHDEVKKALEEGARLRKEAQQMVEDYGKRIAGVDQEIDDLIAGARSDAEKEKARIIASAEAQALALEKEAANRIAAEIDAARHKLEVEVIAAAIAAAEEILSKKTTAADQTKLVDTFIANLSDESTQQELS